MRDIDYYDRDDYSEDEMRRRGDPICRSCYSTAKAVYRDGMCEDCWLAQPGTLARRKSCQS